MKALFSFSACLLLFPGFAVAQSSPQIDVRAAFGMSNYLHGDIDFNAPTTLVAVRFGGDYVAIEPEFAFARHTKTQTFSGTSFGTVTQTFQQKFQSLGVNLVGRWPGRVSPFVGGGLGLYSERRRFESSTGGSNPATTSGPRPGFQLTGGVDVRILPRLRAFGQARYEMRSFRDPGGGSVIQGLGGIAFSVF
jgi:hypothetical protein